MNDPSQILLSSNNSEIESSLNPQQVQMISNIVSQTVYSLLSNKSILTNLIQSNTGNKPLGEAFNEYENYLKGTGYSDQYQRSVKATLNKTVKFFNENTPLKNIYVRQIEEFIIQLMKSMPRGYRVHFRNLKACFSKLVAWGHINNSPFTKIKLPKMQKQENVYVTRDELNTIISKTTHPVMKEMFLFAFLTALRLSEITNLKWNEVKLAEGIITIGSAEFITKTRKIRQIPLVDELIIMLRNKSKIMNIDGYIFCKADGKKYTDDFVSKSFKRALRKTNLDQHTHFHSLRHSGISFMLNNGVPVNVVKEIAGHSSIAVTNIYTHTNLDELKNAVKLLNNKNNFKKAESNNG